MKTKLDIANCQSCVCFNLRKASRAITQFYDHALKPADLKVTQFTILVAVTRADSITISTLAKHLVMDRTTLTRNLRPLEARGFVRVEAGSDQRTRYVSVESEGERVLERALPLWQAAQQKIVKKLGVQSMRDLLKTLSETVSISQQAP